MHEGVLLFLNLGGWQEGWNEHAYVEFDDNNLKNRHLKVYDFLLFRGCLAKMDSMGFLGFQV